MTSPIENLIERGRRRVLWHLFLDKACLALAIFMGGALVLLLVGTQILDWYWLALLALAGLGAGLYQLRGKVPTAYRVAQHIDRKSGLADALSTAFHFGAHPDAGREGLVRLQREKAEEAVPAVDLKAALPYSRSRYLLPAGILAAAAAGMFLLRYAVTGSLDLNGSLVALAADSFFSSPTELAQNDAQKGQVDAKTGENTNPDEQAKDENKQDEETLPESMMEPESESPEGQLDQKGDDKQKDDQGKQDQEEGNDASKSKQDDNGQDSKNSDQPGQQDSKQGNQKNEPSALDKLRDALANLLNKNKSDASKQGQQQNQQKGQAQKSENGEKQESNQGGDSSSQEQGSQQDQNSQQQNNAKGGENQQKNPEASSSQGDKIGDKTLKNTQALEAMGKISELMGKRAENVKGEVMIEVGQTKQQLKTAWSSQTASHSESGGEIHRDEVPLMYQQYVEQYFEALRKTPEGGARVANPAAKPQDKGK